MYDTRNSSHPRQEDRPIADCRLQIAEWKRQSAIRNPQSAIAFCLVLLLLLVVAGPGRASAPAQVAPAVPVAASTGIAPTPVVAFLGLENYSAALTNRTNILRFCMCVMALALFIMLKK
jgi:hypothetical protein